MRMHGTKLFIDAPQSFDEDQDKANTADVQDEDFFDEQKHEQASLSSVQNLPKLAVSLNYQDLEILNGKF